MAFASERHKEKTVQFKSRRCQSTPNIIERHRSYRQNTFAPNGKPINQISPVLFLSISWLVSETSICIIDPAYQEHQEHQEQNRQSNALAISQLIHFNETKMCDFLTNVIFVLLILLVLGCVGFIIALCVNPKVFGIDVINRNSTDTTPLTNNTTLSTSDSTVKLIFVHDILITFVRFSA